MAAYGFSAQIYCDFSGYTDMAIGLAYLLRIRLPTNFLRPYAASSVIHFRRQWHITLSHWLRDYLYIPRGGNRGGRAPQFRNIVITMMLGGLWHGANWTFLIWGLLHGLALGATHLLRSPMRSFGIVLPGWIAVLLHISLRYLRVDFLPRKRHQNRAELHRGPGPRFLARSNLHAAAKRIRHSVAGGIFRPAPIRSPCAPAYLRATRQSLDHYRSDCLFLDVDDRDQPRQFGQIHFF